MITVHAIRLSLKLLIILLWVSISQISVAGCVTQNDLNSTWGLYVGTCILVRPLLYACPLHCYTGAVPWKMGQWCSLMNPEGTTYAYIIAKLPLSLSASPTTCFLDKKPVRLCN